MKEAISVIGLGKLGLCTAACFAQAGYAVAGMDIRTDYVAGLTAGNIPFHEPGLEELLKQTKKNLTFTTSLDAAFQKSSVSFIIVPTPSGPEGAFSNEYIASVLQELGPLLTQKGSFHIVNIVSTVMPGSCRNDFIPLLEKLSGKKAGLDFGIGYNPEFIAIGSVIENFLNPDLVLIGESDERTGAVLAGIYARTCRNSPYMARTSLMNAEIAKLALNCYCTMKISFANNLAAVCEAIPGSDAARICEILGKDSRVGPKYIKPGLGFGGPCFPRDNEAFIRFIEQSHGFPGLQQAVVKINEGQPQRFAEKIARAAAEFGPKVALLGLAYKPDTYLTERSQSLDVAHYLADHYPQLELNVYDPLARANGPWRQAATLEECVAGANVTAILTPWRDFLSSNWRSLLSDHSLILNFWN